MQDSFKNLSDFAETIVELKKAESSAAKIKAACCAGSVHLLRCRELARHAALEAEQIREQTAMQRNQLDHDSLQLHNLVYEQQYYDKEVASCRTFQSSVPDEQLSCISLEQFAHQAETAVAGTAHNQELARLNCELQQRKQLMAHLQALQQEKQHAAATLGAAAGRIDDLRTHMESISNSSRPLVESSLPDTASIRSNKQAAELLPLPLYIIYTQAATGRSVLGLPIKVDIDGSLTAAARCGPEPAADNNAATTQSAKKRRKPGSRDDHVCKMHPLSVTVEVAGSRESDAEPVMQLTFHYYTQLKLVGVSASTPADEEVLTDLFLGDAGDGRLLENVALATNVGSLQFGAAGKPRPFRWAQDLAGLDVLASVPSRLLPGENGERLLSILSAHRSQLHLEAFVQRLVAAKQGWLALKAILEQLEKKEQPSTGVEHSIPTKVNTVITSWQHLGDKAQHSRRLDGLVPASKGPAAADSGRGRGNLQAVQGSMQEEGEVAGAVADGVELTSRLQHGDTAEEDLLQGLLAEDASAVEAEAIDALMLAGTNGVRNGADGDMLVLHEHGVREESQGAYSKQHKQQSAAGGRSSTSDAVPADADCDEVAVSSKPSAVVMQYALYRLVLRSAAIEAQLDVKVFANYPLCPPAFQIKKVLDATRSKPTPILAVNEVLWLEQQANVRAVQVASISTEVLAVQVLLLRQCVDSISAQYRTDGSSKDLVDRLRAKQHLRGRERQPHLLLAKCLSS